MTNNTDDFEQDEFQAEEELAQDTPKKGLAETLRAKPAVKLALIMGVVGVSIAAALGAFSSGPEQPKSTIVAPPDVHEAPGGQSSPYFIDQNKQANEQRANQAMQQGGSAIPTPAGNVDEFKTAKDDPLMEFRAETERLKEQMKQQQMQNQMQMQQMQQQVQISQRNPEDDSLARAMQAQMKQLMDGWAPRAMKLVAGTTKEDDSKAAVRSNEFASNASPQSQNASDFKAQSKKALVAAGTVNYAQLLTEANSDIQAPILAQILSGPLAGGRAVGRFQVTNDYLVMEFTLVSLKGKDYAINALALDPDTTLSGMATEVDHRYFARVLLPAAGSFVSAFGSAMSDSGTTTTVSDGAVIVNNAKKGIDDATYAGLGQMGNTIGQFFQQEAAKTKTLVRVAVGTPMGLFFLNSVQADQDSQQMQGQRAGNMASGLANAYSGLQNGGYSVIGSGTNMQSLGSSGVQTTTFNPYSSNTAYGQEMTNYGSNRSTGMTTVPTSSGVYTRY